MLEKQLQGVASIPHAYGHALMLIPYGFIIALLCGILLTETHGQRIEDRNR